jgi:hypothetical protein
MLFYEIPKTILLFKHKHNNNDFNYTSNITNRTVLSFISVLLTCFTVRYNNFWVINFYDEHFVVHKIWCINIRVDWKWILFEIFQVVWNNYEGKNCRRYKGFSSITCQKFSAYQQRVSAENSTHFNNYGNQNVRTLDFW